MDKKWSRFAHARFLGRLRYALIFTLLYMATLVARSYAVAAGGDTWLLPILEAARRPMAFMKSGGDSSFAALTAFACEACVLVVAVWRAVAGSRRLVTRGGIVELLTTTRCVAHCMHYPRTPDGPYYLL